MDVALSFSLQEVKQGQASIVYEIEFQGTHGLFEMSKGYSSFEEEQEVLVQDGLEYEITEITNKIQTDEEEGDKAYILVKLATKKK